MKKKTKLSFFTSDIEPSKAEDLIIYYLNKYNIPFNREVSFKGFISPKGGYYRYDFYLPQYNLIIEYDGKMYHDNKVNDIIKNTFCRKNNINIVRFNSKHYYHLNTEIQKLIKQYDKKQKSIKKNY